MCIRMIKIIIPFTREQKVPCIWVPPSVENVACDCVSCNAFNKNKTNENYRLLRNTQLHKVRITGVNKKTKQLINTSDLLRIARNDRAVVLAHTSYSDCFTVKREK